ncbi:MAG: hypothetical protein FJ291_00515 [Planctomycetes bacterium]|nr:hypothetical protein [Planctomycetota bacterium]
MIYEFPSQEAAIRQGDIFVGLPRLDISLRRFVVLSEDDSIRMRLWSEVAEEGQRVTAAVAASPVAAVVISQDCDALHVPDITLCEIRPFRDVERKSKDTTEPTSWMKIITQHARINQKWFYLPPDQGVGFTTKMAVDFTVTLRVPRVELEELRHLRAGRLNDYAEAHFRERIAEFFRRFPYDEWYALDAAEMQAYAKAHPTAQPYPWQAGVQHS